MRVSVLHFSFSLRVRFHVSLQARLLDSASLVEGMNTSARLVAKV